MTGGSPHEAGHQVSPQTDGVANTVLTKCNSSFQLGASIEKNRLSITLKYSGFEFFIYLLLVIFKDLDLKEDVAKEKNSAQVMRIYGSK